MTFDVYRGIGQLPLYNEDLDGATPPAEVADLRRRIEAVDALFWAVPEYNHTIPAVIKNLIEWTSHPLSSAVLVGKISAIAVATQGRGGYRGMADLARVLRDLGGHVVAAPEVCLHLAQHAIREREDGTVTIGDAVAEKLIRTLLRSLRVSIIGNAGRHSGAPWHAIFAEQHMASSRR